MASTTPQLSRLSPSSRATDASAKPRTKLLAALRKSTAGSSDSETESESNASVSENDTRSSPARACSPRLTSQDLDAHSSDDAQESDGGNAYERMKQRLAATNALPTQENPKSQSPGRLAIASSEDEDEMPVLTKARIATTKRRKTTSPTASPSPTRTSRRSSPGLFVTPDGSPVKQLRAAAHAGYEGDDVSNPSLETDLQSRVRRIRAERLARQQEEQAQQRKTKDAAQSHAGHGSGSDTDGENGRKLTQQAKPTRKAGKKALEAMARDQQRISRNMQLTHQAKTKKRFTTQDLFAKMGFNAPTNGAESLPTPEASSALSSSDVEAGQLHNTPPASPLKQIRAVEQDAAGSIATETRQLEDASITPPKLDKGKGRALDSQHLPPHPWSEAVEPVNARRAVVQTSKVTDGAMVELSDTDSEIEIVQPKSRFPVFDRLPTKKQHESASLLHLRSLAQLIGSPEQRQKGQKSLTLGQFEFSLAQRARQQANQARAAKLADMIARGAHVETEEEREKRQVEIDDMVAQFEKQREEDQQLAKMERQEAKKNGEILDGLPSSDEEDGDYVGSGEENSNHEESEPEVEVEIELSGSEDEDMEDAVNSEGDGPTEDSNNLIDGMAEQDDANEEHTASEQAGEDADIEDEEAIAPSRKRTANRARARVVVEEDESDTEPIQPASPTQQATPENAMAAFGFGNADAGLGLTQMFAGTMADMESGSQSQAEGAPVHETEQNSLDFLRSLPDTQPGANFSQTTDMLVPNSQSLFSPQKESQTNAESQFSLGISQLVKTSPAFSRTQLEDFEPTQDAGFSFSRSPAGLVPLPSTIDTVILPVTESPVKQRKGKLQRGRKDAMVELSDMEQDLAEADDSLNEDDIQLPPKPRDAFSKLQKAAKRQKAVDDFDRDTSMAKNAVMEQAEESEDEYAGIGGASDDDEGEEDQELKDMIDHNDVDVDERQLAALYA